MTTRQQTACIICQTQLLDRRERGSRICHQCASGGHQKLNRMVVGSLIVVFSGVAVLAVMLAAAMKFLKGVF